MFVLFLLLLSLFDFFLWFLLSLINFVRLCNREWGGGGGEWGEMEGIGEMGGGGFEQHPTVKLRLAVRYKSLK